jgi:tetratricopeptide (TPR) repeat protein
MPDGVEMRDFFISFNKADLAFAEAIDAALRAAGFTTFYHPRDLGPGGNIPIWMDDALMNSAQTLALYSPAYTGDKAIYSKAERYATWWQDPGGDKRKLIPILVRETTFTPLMAMISRIEVLGMTPDEAAAHVIQRLKQPKEAEPRDLWRRGLPHPTIFNVAYRPNPNFTGRFEALESLQHSLRAGSNAAITAVAGMGGIGKTTLAAEYCHRFGGRYAGVWWVRAEQEPVMLADLQMLGKTLGIATTGNVEQDARAALDRLGGLTEPWLMVYDNAPNPDGVRNWLPAGAVRAIITSRFTEFGDLAPVTRVDQWPDAVTADYLLTRTGRDDAEGAARLAKALGGLPLAAEQAAAFLGPRKNISFDDYAKEIARLIKRKKDAGIAGDYPDTVYAAFVKSLETLQDMQGGTTALDLLCLCAFLSPDGVDLALVTVEGIEAVLPASFATAMADTFTREDALAVLVSLSLLRQEDGPFGPVLIFHRLLLEVVRDWMGEDARALWGSVAVQLVSGVFPGGAVHMEPSIWPRCARLMPHVAPLDAHAPRTGDAGRALGYLLNQAGLYLVARGDRVGALMLAQKAVALMRVMHADDPLFLAAGLNNLAGCYGSFGRFKEEEAAYREALEIEESLLGQSDPSLAATLSNLAGVYGRQREFPTAETMYVRAAEIMKAALGPDSAEYGRALSNLGLLYGQWWEALANEPLRAKAADIMTKALIITSTGRGSRHPETATRHANLAGLNARMDDWQGAAAEAERNLATKLSLGLLEHPDTGDAIREIIHFWERSGQADQAARLRGGDISDLVPVIAGIELEHRAWVAADPRNRHFGPPSFFVASESHFKKSLQILASAGVDVADVIRRVKAGELSRDNLAVLAAEAIVGKQR